MPASETAKISGEIAELETIVRRNAAGGGYHTLALLLLCKCILHLESYMQKT